MRNARTSLLKQAGFLKEFMLLLVTSLSTFLLLLNLKSHLCVLFSLPHTKVENTSALP